jgi:hypothetical protein
MAELVDVVGIACVDNNERDTPRSTITVANRESHLAFVVVLPAEQALVHVLVAHVDRRRFAQRSVRRLDLPRAQRVELPTPTRVLDGIVWVFVRCADSLEGVSVTVTCAGHGQDDWLASKQVCCREAQRLDGKASGR